MSASINENTQYTDPATGELLVNGFVYIGTVGLDAKLNTIAIFADRDLTTALLNPQRTGSDGRVVNKIWVPGQYSLLVENFENEQKLNDLSAGSDSITGNSILTDVSGTNAIIATAVSTASSLVNNQVYILTAANTNTGAMTLTIDSFTTYPIRKHHDVIMEAGDIEQNQTVAVVFNETDSTFELITNSAVAPVDISRAQTVAGVKTFTGGIVGDLTGNADSATKHGILNLKVIEIGDWDMDASNLTAVAHGITSTKIRTVTTLIRNDANTLFHPLMFVTGSEGSLNRGELIESTNITLYRDDGGQFNNANYNSTSYNRGWVTIQYID